MERWYAIHTHTRAERLGLGHLRRQGFDAYLPQYLKRRRHARRTDWVPASLFPGYLFVRMDPAAARWRAIQSTVGIRDLVCFGDMPAALPDGIVEGIRDREDDRGFVRMDTVAPFAKGNKVQIAAGALCEQVGLFDCMTDDERVVVLLDLLGRPLKVRLPVEAVVAYA